MTYPMYHLNSEQALWDQRIYRMLFYVLSFIFVIGTVNSTLNEGQRSDSREDQKLSLHSGQISLNFEQ